MLRNAMGSDAKAVLENFNKVHAETDFLLSYPDEMVLCQDFGQ